MNLCGTIEKGESKRGRNENEEEEKEEKKNWVSVTSDELIEDRMLFFSGTQQLARWFTISVFSVGFPLSSPFDATRNPSLVSLLLFPIVHGRSHIHRTGTDGEWALREWRLTRRCSTFSVIRLCPRSTRLWPVRTCPAFVAFDWDSI